VSPRDQVPELIGWELDNQKQGLKFRLGASKNRTDGEARTPVA